MSQFLRDFLPTLDDEKLKSVGVGVSVLIIIKMILILLHSERPKLHTILAFLSAVGLKYTDKGDKFCDLLLASLDDKIFPKGVHF